MWGGSEGDEGVWWRRGTKVSIPELGRHKQEGEAQVLAAPLLPFPQLSWDGTLQRPLQFSGTRTLLPL